MIGEDNQSKNNVNVIGEDNQREMNTNDKVFFLNLKENPTKIKIHHHPKKEFGCECDLRIVVQYINTIHNDSKANCNYFL